MLTSNEKKILKLLISSFNVDYSINQIARQCGLAPNGAFKILKKFEKEGILKQKKIANIISYKLDYDNEKTDSILELALIPELKGRIKYRLDDFAELKAITESCIMFGSYVDLKKEPEDLDVLFILNKGNFREYKRKLVAIKDIVPVKIHDILQTEEDIKRNIVKNDDVLVEILRKGLILWGYKKIIGVVKDANKR